MSKKESIIVSEDLVIVEWLKKVDFLPQDITVVSVEEIFDTVSTEDKDIYGFNLPLEYWMYANSYTDIEVMSCIPPDTNDDNFEQVLSNLQSAPACTTVEECEARLVYSWIRTVPSNVTFKLVEDIETNIVK